MQQPQPQPQPQPQQKGSISPFLAPLPTEKKKGQQLRLDLPKGSTTSAFSAQSTPRTAAGGTSAESPRGDVLSPKEPVASAPMVANATSAQKPGFQKPKTRSNTLYADAKTDKETVGKKVRTTLGNSARVIKTRLQSPGYYQRNTDDDYGDEYDENVSVSDASDNITDSSVVPRPPPIKIPTPQQTQQSQQQSQPEKKVVIQEDSNMELSSAVADEYYGGPGNDEVYSTGSEYNETSLLKSSIHQPEVTEPIPHLQPVMSTKMAADVKDSENALKARRGKAVSMSMMNFPKPENPQSLPEPGETPGGGSWKEYPLSRKFSVGNSIEYYSYIPDNASDVSNNSNNSNNNNMKFEPPSPGGGGGGGTARGGSGGSSSGSSTLRSVIHDFLNFESYENEDVERKTTKILKKRYILGNLLGRGSFAKVKEAYDLKLHKIVAIKIFNHASLSSIPNGISSMEEEFFVYRRLPPHKNVVSMIDSWDDDNKGRSYLVMDYMSGGTLDSLIRKAWSNSTTTTITTTTSEESSSSNTTTNNNNVRGLPLSQIRTLFRKALIGLNHLHKNGVYHRDIKPDNLMLTPDLNVCVSDFGTATLEASTRGIGAPGFQPPEVILTGTAPDSAKIDTWAMGVTLHMMATGMHPFGTQAASLYQLIERIGNRPYEPPEGLPEQLCDLLCKALTRDPQERLTVDAMLEHPWMTQGMNEDEDENNMAEFVLPDLLTTVFTDANVAHLQTEFTYIEQSDGNVHMEEVLDVEIEGDSIRLKKKKKMMRKKSCCDCCCCCCCCIIA